jgi:hypothetical protein
MLIEEGVDQGPKKVETKEGCWWMNAGWMLEEVEDGWGNSEVESWVLGLSDL